MGIEWSDRTAAEWIASCGDECPREMALRLYLDSLIESEPSLNLGNGSFHSVKLSACDLLGQERTVLFTRSNDKTVLRGRDSYAGFDLASLGRLRQLRELAAGDFERELLAHRLDHHDRIPRPETLLHSFIRAAFVDQTSPADVLVLCRLRDAPARLREALGDSVLVMENPDPGFPGARRALDLLQDREDATALVWMQRGILTWGESAREAWDALQTTVRRAASYLRQRTRRSWIAAGADAAAAAYRRLETVAPAIRGALSRRTDNPDRPYLPAILHAVADHEVLGFLEWEGSRSLPAVLPLHHEHVPLMGGAPLLVEAAPHEDAFALRRQVTEAVARRVSGNAEPFPRVLLIPGLGLIGSGLDAEAARRSAEVAWRSLAEVGRVGCDPAEFAASRRPVEKWLDSATKSLSDLSGRACLVTGAAGAIGAGICEELLREGCHVAVSDLAGSRLDGLVSELADLYPGRVLGVVMDVTSPESVREGWRQVNRTWGGVDLLVANAGVAHVSPLAEMDLESFRHAECINTEGTLLVLSEAARQFRLQGIGGDIVLISTKNVFAPGAGFAAYSATKAAAHQLARIASLELADIGVRVNMVAPDAVFSHGGRRSGLWEEVGPGRMRARGLDAAGLEEYYRNRNLLKVRVTARHVARAVLFFMKRQTPTTGATIPVDGGLPDSTQR